MRRARCHVIREVVVGVVAARVRAFGPRSGEGCSGILVVNDDVGRRRCAAQIHELHGIGDYVRGAAAFTRLVVQHDLAAGARRERQVGGDQIPLAPAGRLVEGCGRRPAVVRNRVGRRGGVIAEDGILAINGVVARRCDRGRPGVGRVRAGPAVENPPVVAAIAAISSRGPRSGCARPGISVVEDDLRRRRAGGEHVVAGSRRAVSVHRNALEVIRGARRKASKREAVAGDQSRVGHLAAVRRGRPVVDRAARSLVGSPRDGRR